MKGHITPPFRLIKRVSETKVKTALFLDENVSPPHDIDPGLYGAPPVLANQEERKAKRIARRKKEKEELSGEIKSAEL